MFKINKKHFSPVWLAYAAVILIIALIGLENSFRDTDIWISDLVFQPGEKFNTDIRVIGIDDKTLDKYGTFDTWGRDKIADIIDMLMADEENAPALIGIDVGFYDEKDAAADRRLAESVARAGNVILPEYAYTEYVSVRNDDGTYSEVEMVRELDIPYDSLREAALATGHNNLYLDRDGTLRHALAGLVSEDGNLTSFAYEMYKHYTGKTDERYNIPDDIFYITYSGKPGAYYNAVNDGCSFADVLEGNCPKDAFRDSIVIIGDYAMGMRDNYYTSVIHSNQMYGVEVHANILAQMIAGRYIKEASGLSIVLTTILIGILVCLIFFTVPTAMSILVSFGVSFLYILAAKAVYSGAETELPVLAPVIVIFALCLVHFFAHFIRAIEERKITIERFSRYLAPEVARRISDMSIEEAWPVKEEDIAVMYVDIHSFTSISETVDPNVLVSMLRQFFDEMLESAFRFGGTCDKMIGDCVMVLFGAPIRIEDYEYKAVLAALDMAKKIESGLVKIDLGNGPEPISIGLGISCGKVVCGEMGSRKYRVEYTALGDPVNVASRIEDIAGNNEILISEEMFRRTGDRFNTELKGTYHLKGKSEEMNVYRVLSVKKEA